MKARSKTRIAAVTAVVVVCLAGTAMAQGPSTSWYNETETTFEISNANQFWGLALLVNGGNSFAGKTIKLTANISLLTHTVGEGWEPVGIEGYPFSGAFDGGGHVISNLTINRPEGISQGLFGNIIEGKVENLGLENVNINGRVNVGSIVGYIENGIISKCYSTGTVTGTNMMVGGIVGQAYGGNSIANSYSAVAVSSTGSQVGGIAGMISVSTSISNCYSFGKVSGQSNVGGIVGITLNSGNSITNSAALNPEVVATGADAVVRRIAGDGLSGIIFANNVAFAGMTNAAGTTDWDNKGADTRNGEDISADNIRSNGNLGGRFTAANGWTVAAGKLPGLFGKTVNMPTHLLPPLPDGTQWYVNAINANPSASSFTLSTASDLAGLAALVNGGIDNFAEKTVRINADINLSDFAAGEGWTPIGNSSGNSFRGTFNGQYRVISGLRINRPGAGYQGLFGYVIGGKVENVSLEDVVIIAGHTSGGLVGSIEDGIISRCYSTGAITGSSVNIGGIAGITRGTSIANCYSAVAVSSTDVQIGGIAGSIALSSSISNCYSFGKVSGRSNVGGIVGVLSGAGSSITNSAALNPEVIATGTDAVVRRVAGGGSSGILTNNVAFSGMKNADGAADWANKGADARDGADITANEIGSNGSIGGRFPAYSGWTIAAGKLPGHLDAVEMPEHLKEEIVNAAQPVIATHPASATVTEGASHTMTVAATSPDDGVLSYRWYSSTTAANTGGTVISGATGASYSPSTDASGTFHYYVVVTNTNSGVNGQKSVTSVSSVATLTVNIPENAAIPVITSHPASDAAAPGTAHTFTVTASVPDGGALSYQWYSNTTMSNAGGTAIAGATSASYSHSTGTPGSYHFYVVVTNTDNSASGEKTASVTSNVAVLIVLSVAVAEIDRVIPGDTEETAVVAPVRPLSVGFTAGPNPVAINAGAVNFYRTGKSLQSGTLTIYDASGNVVNKVVINGGSGISDGNRQVGSWDLTDRRGRTVSAGTYLVRGTVVAVDGKKERVSLKVGVR